MWDRWDVLLLVIAGYVAVMSLVRLMSTRRRELAAKFRAQMQAERQRVAAEVARKKRAEIMAAQRDKVA